MLTEKSPHLYIIAGPNCSGNKERLAVITDNLLIIFGVPTGSRTPVTGVKGQCPRPLDDGDVWTIQATSEGQHRIQQVISQVGAYIFFPRKMSSGK